MPAKKEPYPCGEFKRHACIGKECTYVDPRKFKPKPIVDRKKQTVLQEQINTQRKLKKIERQMNELPK